MGLSIIMGLKPTIGIRADAQMNRARLASVSLSLCIGKRQTLEAFAHQAN